MQVKQKSVTLRVERKLGNDFENVLHAYQHPQMLNVCARCHAAFHAASGDERKCDYSLPFQFGSVRALSNL